MNLIFEEEAYLIRGAVFEVYKATNLELGLLINFGSHPKAQIERFAL